MGLSRRGCGGCRGMVTAIPVHLVVSAMMAWAVVYPAATAAVRLKYRQGQN